MVAAARQLIGERGYHATAMSDVLERSAAPRGSVYYHFPGGKAQLVAEVAEAHAREQVAEIDRAAESARSPEHLVRSYVDLARDNLVNSDYQRGCAIAPLVIEVGEESEKLGDACRRAFSAITDGMAFRLSVLGLDDATARELAHSVVAAVEGALVTSRALRSPEPFVSVSAMLVDRARTLGREQVPPVTEAGQLVHQRPLPMRAESLDSVQAPRHCGEHVPLETSPPSMPLANVDAPSTPTFIQPRNPPDL
jgi:AcrR family transcriptional regulator